MEPARKNRELKRVDTVLGDVMAKLGLDRRLREHTLFNLWAELAGKQLSGRSRPIFIDADFNLVVAVADAATGQELSLLKGKIVRRLKSAGQSLGIDIKGLRFDLKHFHSKQEADIHVPPAEHRQPAPGELDQITLNQQELSEIAWLKESLNDKSGSISSNRIVLVFEKELRLRHWMRQNSFPICRSCQCPSRCLLGAEDLCLACSLRPLSAL